MTPLKNMNSLYTLEIGGNPVENFEILEGLTNLAELDISDTNCTSINFLNNTKKTKAFNCKKY